MEEEDEEVRLLIEESVLLVFGVVVDGVLTEELVSLSCMKFPWFGLEWE